MIELLESFFRRSPKIYRNLTFSLFIYFRKKFFLFFFFLEITKNLRTFYPPFFFGDHQRSEKIQLQNLVKTVFSKAQRFSIKIIFIVIRKYLSTLLVALTFFFAFPVSKCFVLSVYKHIIEVRVLSLVGKDYIYIISTAIFNIFLCKCKRT